MLDFSRCSKLCELYISIRSLVHCYDFSPQHGQLSFLLGCYLQIIFSVFRLSYLLLTVTLWGCKFVWFIGWVLNLLLVSLIDTYFTLTGTHCKENRNQTRPKQLWKRCKATRNVWTCVTKVPKQQHTKRETIIGDCNWFQL